MRWFPLSIIVDFPKSITFLNDHVWLLTLEPLAQFIMFLTLILFIYLFIFTFKRTRFLFFQLLRRGRQSCEQRILSHIKVATAKITTTLLECTANY